MESEKVPQIENLGKIKAYIAKDPSGVHRIFCQRGRRKWWRELGQHRATDAAFETALAEGSIEWRGKIIGTDKLF